MCWRRGAGDPPPHATGATGGELLSGRLWLAGGAASGVCGGLGGILRIGEGGAGGGCTGLSLLGGHGEEGRRAHTVCTRRNKNSYTLLGV